MQPDGVWARAAGRGSLGPGDSRAARVGEAEPSRFEKGFGIQKAYVCLFIVSMFKRLAPECRLFEDV